MYCDNTSNKFQDNCVINENKNCSDFSNFTNPNSSCNCNKNNNSNCNSGFNFSNYLPIIIVIIIFILFFCNNKNEQC